MNPRRQEPDHFRVDDGGEDCVPREGGHDHGEHAFPPPVNPPYGTPHGGGPDIELYDLIDYSMPVGNTGIVFVAGLTGWRESDGTALFIPGAVAAAYRRAASTLAHMALIAGSTFQFIRLAQNMSTAQAAAQCGVAESVITAWEAGTTPVPAISWQVMADLAAQADQRAGIAWTPLPSINLRPRVIRVYPDIPYPGQTLPSCPPVCPPCPPPCSC